MFDEALPPAEDDDDPAPWPSPKPPTRLRAPSRGDPVIEASEPERARGRSAGLLRVIMSARRELRREEETGCEASTELPRPPKGPSADSADWLRDTGKMGGVKLGPSKGRLLPPDGDFNSALWPRCNVFGADALDPPLPCWDPPVPPLPLEGCGIEPANGVDG